MSRINTVLSYKRLQITNFLWNKFQFSRINFSTLPVPLVENCQYSSSCPVWASGFLAYTKASVSTVTCFHSNLKTLNQIPPFCHYRWLYLHLTCKSKLHQCWKKALHLGEIIGFQQRGQEVQKRLLPRLFAFQSIDNYFWLLQTLMTSRH